MPRIQLLEEPHCCHPINAEGGLYVYLLSEDGHLEPGDILDFCRPIALAHGYNPDGRATLGLPTVHGIKSRTYAVWFHEKAPPGTAQDSGTRPPR